MSVEDALSALAWIADEMPGVRIVLSYCDGKGELRAEMPGESKVLRRFEVRNGVARTVSRGEPVKRGMRAVGGG